MTQHQVQEDLSRSLQNYVERGDIAGATALVWRAGTVVHAVSTGRRDLVTGRPVERDTLFRIASMSKPVTTVAALTLLDEGRFALDEPIASHAPEFGAMRVLRDVDGPLDATESAGRAITFDDLLTHRAGLTYGDFHRGPIAAAYAEALGASLDSRHTPDTWMARLAALPLIDQPGARFHYSHATDLLGCLLARIERAPLGDVLARRVFEPLGMRDTGFVVGPDARDRRAGLCGFDEAGRPVPLSTTPGGHAVADRPTGLTFESGGQGLWSTADDYLKLARMFVGDGTVDGVRLLRPNTLARMRSNQLTPAQRAEARMFGQALFARGHGYGMGVAVVMEPESADPLRCGGSAGAVGWPGAWGGWWQADPATDSVLIFLAHSMAGLDQMAQGIGLGVWDAIATFQRLGTAAVQR